MGRRFTCERRAINLDPNFACARGNTGVPYVADAFEFVRKTNTVLRESPTSQRAPILPKKSRLKSARRINQNALKSDGLIESVGV
jgi:hypothetical protein